jgi:hypothetical protein
MIFKFIHLKKVYFLKMCLNFGGSKQNKTNQIHIIEIMVRHELLGKYLYPISSAKSCYHVLLRYKYFPYTSRTGLL